MAARSIGTGPSAGRSWRCQRVSNCRALTQHRLGCNRLTPIRRRGSQWSSQLKHGISPWLSPKGCSGQPAAHGHFQPPCLHGVGSFPSPCIPLEMPPGRPVLPTWTSPTSTLLTHAMPRHCGHAMPITTSQAPGSVFTSVLQPSATSHMMPPCRSLCTRRWDCRQQLYRDPRYPRFPRLSFPEPHCSSQ